MVQRLELVCGVLILSSLVAGCGATPDGVLPQSRGPAPKPDLVLVWVGVGEAERFEDGAWRRAEPFDYEFTVEQRRFADRWESVKHLVRRHPDYDGSAGPREQTMYFRLALEEPGEKVPVRISSSLGEGRGEADRSFRKASFEIAADVSSLAPFDTYRIDQQYRYEEGLLTETVSLDEGRSPWVRNQEKARLFAPQSFATPPTTR
jgi:hypothetical protein